MKEINRKWLILIITALVVFWIGSAVRYRLLLSQVRSLKLCTVVLQAVDSVNSSTLPTAVSLPKQKSMFPAELEYRAVENSAIEARWIGDKAVSFVVSSRGYEKKIVTVNKESPWRITVSLDRLDKPAE